MVKIYNKGGGSFVEIRDSGVPDYQNHCKVPCRDNGLACERWDKHIKKHHQRGSQCAGENQDQSLLQS